MEAPMTKFRELGFAMMLCLPVACGGGSEDSTRKQSALEACGLDDVEADADLRACDPSETHKTTICHIPPGNPANAHTLCIGTPAVKHHLKNHNDYVGACKAEVPCPPPGGGEGGGGGGGEGGG